jgi:hypothetical protein
LPLPLPPARPEEKLDPEVRRNIERLIFLHQARRDIEAGFRREEQREEELARRGPALHGLIRGATEAGRGLRALPTAYLAGVEKIPEVTAGLLDPERKRPVLRKIGEKAGEATQLGIQLGVPGMIYGTAGAEAAEALGITTQRPSRRGLTPGQKAKQVLGSGVRLALFKVLPKLGTQKGQVVKPFLNWLGRKAATGIVAVPAVKRSLEAMQKTIAEGGSPQDAFLAALDTGATESTLFYLAGKMNQWFDQKGRTFRELVPVEPPTAPGAPPTGRKAKDIARPPFEFRERRVHPFAEPRARRAEAREAAFQREAEAITEGAAREAIEKQVLSRPPQRMQVRPLPVSKKQRELERHLLRKKQLAQLATQPREVEFREWKAQQKLRKRAAQHVHPKQEFARQPIPTPEAAPERGALTAPTPPGVPPPAPPRPPGAARELAARGVEAGRVVERRPLPTRKPAPTKVPPSEGLGLPPGATMEAPRNQPYKEVRVSVPKTAALAHFRKEITALQAQARGETGIDKSMTNTEIKIVKQNIAKVQKTPGKTVDMRAFQPVERPARPLPTKVPGPPTAEPKPPKAAKSLKPGPVTAIRSPGEKQGQKAHTAFVELDDMVASHKPVGDTLVADKRFGGFQPRKYARGTPEHDLVFERAAALDVGELLSGTLRGDSGPPITSPNAHLVGGHGRTMTLKVAAARGGLKAYDAAVRKRAASLGIDIKGMKQPVLVRVVDMHPAGLKAKRLAEATNISATTAQPVLQAARRAKAVGPIKAGILKSLRLERPEGGKPITFREAVKHPTRGRAFREMLRKDTPSAEQATYFTKAGELTPAGEAYAEARLLLEGYPAKTVEAVQAGRASLAGTLTQTLPQVLALKRDFPGADISKPMTEAVDFLARNPEVTKPGHVEDVLGQTMLIGKAQKLSGTGRMLTDWLLSKPPGAKRTFAESPAQARKVLGAALSEMGQPLLAAGRTPLDILQQALKPAARPLPTKAPTGEELIAERFKDVPREFQEEMPPGRTPLGGLPFLPGPKGAIRKGQQTLLPAKDVKFQKRHQKPLPTKARFPKEADPLRLPPDAEVEAVKLDAAMARREVRRFAGRKFAKEPGVVEKPTLWTRIKRHPAIQAITRGSINPETSIEEMAGKGSTLYKAVNEGLREGRHTATNLYVGGRNSGLDALKKHGMTEKYIAQSQSKSVPWLGGTRKLPVGVVGWIYQLTRDPYAKKVLSRDGVTFETNAKPWRIAPAEIPRLVAELKARYPKDAAFADFAFETRNIVWGPRIQRIAWQETGRKINLTGKYTPVMRDIRRLRAERAWLNTPEAQYKRFMSEMFAGYGGEDAAREFGGSQAKAEARLATVAREQSLRGPRPELTVSPKSRKGRIGGSAPIFVTDQYTNYFNELNRMATYVGKALPVRNAKYVLTQIEPAVREAFADGDIRMQDLYNHLRAYEGRDIGTGSTMERMAGGMMRRLTRGVLSLKPHTGAIQTISYGTALVDIPAKHLFSKDALFGSGKQTMKEIKQWGPELEVRFEGIGRMFMTPTLSPSIKEQVRLFYGGKRPLASRVGLSMIRAGDRWAVLRLWRANKHWAQADGFTGEKLMQETRRRTMRVMDRTQPTSDPMTLARLQMEARRSPVQKALVFLTGQANKLTNIAVRAVNTYQHSKGTMADKAKLAKDVTISLGLNAAAVYGIGTGMRHLYGYDATEKSFADHVVGVMNRAMGGWLLVAPTQEKIVSVIRKVAKGKSHLFLEPRHNPLVEAGDTGIEVISAIAQLYYDDPRFKTGARRGEKKWPTNMRRAILAAMRALAVLTGAPTGGIEQIGRPTVLPKQGKEPVGLPRLIRGR